VEVFASWCRPCVAAVPRWQELRKRYGPEGLRVLVVSLDDDCRAPGWKPDAVVCDTEGRQALRLGVGERLPAALLWSWQGDLLVRRGHVAEVERAVRERVSRSPRGLVVVKSTSAEPGVVALLAEELARADKLRVMPDLVAQRTMRGVYRESSGSCGPGLQRAPVSVLHATVLGRSLVVEQRSWMGGCLLARAATRWDPDRPRAAVHLAVARLLDQLHGDVQLPGEKAPPAAFGPNSGPARRVRGRLRVEGRPAGAVVEVTGPDGSGSTRTGPLPEVFDLEPGVYRVRVMAVHFVPHETIHRVEPDLTTIALVELVRPGPAAHNPTMVRPAPLERYPTIESPDVVASGVEFSVQVSLCTERLTPSVRVRDGGSATEGAVALPLPPVVPEDGWTLDVVLSAPGFASVAGGTNHGQIRLRREGDSTPARFLLRWDGPPPAGPRRIDAVFWHQGTYLARASRELTVSAPPRAERRARSAALPLAPPEALPAAAMAERAPAAVTPRPQPVALDLSLRRPDMTLWVRTTRQEVVVLAPAHSMQPLHERLMQPPGLRDWVLREYESILADLPVGAGRVSKAATERVRGFGRRLYQRAAPQVFRQAYWGLRDRLGDRFLTIQIFSDDPGVPWELMCPSAQGRQAGFLGLEHRVGRWHVSDHPSGLERPPQRLLLDEVVAVVPRYRGRWFLPGLGEDVDPWRDDPRFRVVSGTSDQVARLVRTPPRGILHVSGHGVVEQEGAVPRFSIRLEDGVLDPTRWAGLLQGTGAVPDRHPLVFFNTCFGGQARRVAGTVEGWAPAVVEAGASGYIGGLWQLRSEAAIRFARGFHATLRARLARGPANVAELLRSQRRALFEATGDPTYLAYVFYGDPHLQVADRSGR